MSEKHEKQFGGARVPGSFGQAEDEASLGADPTDDELNVLIENALREAKQQLAGAPAQGLRVANSARMISE